MAGASKLAVNVHAQKEGETRYFEAGSTPPAEWAKVITNPKAWGGDAPEVEETPATPAEPQEPPRSGSGSGDKAWVAFGESVGLDTSSGKKADIIAQWDARQSDDSSDDNAEAEEE